MSSGSEGSRSGGQLEPLWRHLLGRKLRELRLGNGEKLAETAERAGVSPQYLSEVERGLKEPSSEMIAAIAGSLGLTLLDLTTELSADLREFHEPSRLDRPSATLLLAA